VIGDPGAKANDSIIVSLEITIYSLEAVDVPLMLSDAKLDMVATPHKMSNWPRVTFHYKAPMRDWYVRIPSWSHAGERSSSR
jgi:hypothetical protein